MGRGSAALDEARIASLVGKVLWPLESLRRYLARNHPYLWLMRLHSFLFLFLTLSVVCAVLGFLIPVSKYSVPNIEGWHFVLFLLSLLCVLYWLVSYLLLLDPSQMPPSMREPPVVVLVVCAVLILLPSYLFLSLATYRIAHAFPDIAYEEQARSILSVLAGNAGDRNGIFQGGKLRAGQRIGLAFSPPPGAASQDDPKPEYFVGSDGVIGPMEKKGAPTKEFRRDLVCGIGYRSIQNVLLENRFSIQGSGASGEDGRLLFLGTRAMSGKRAGQLQPLNSAYASALTYKVYGEALAAAHPFELTFDGTTYRSGITVGLECSRLTEQMVDEIFDQISQLSLDLFRSYLPPMAEDEVAKLSNAVLTPFCEVGKRADDCNSDFRKLEGVVARFKVDPADGKLRIIKTAAGYAEMNAGFEATLSDNTNGAERELTISAKQPIGDTNRAAALSGGWFVVWLVVLALLAASAKSFRLVREAPANYVFAALFFVPAVIIAALFGGWINERLSAAAGYFGWQISISLNAGTMLLGYSIIALAYVVWQVTRRRCSRAARMIASFNLFFLLVMSLYLPFMNFPMLGRMPEEGWSLTIAYVVYFGLLFDAFYALARRARERPA